MAEKGFLEDRGKSLEEAFFAKQEQKLREKFRAEAEAAENREELKKISGISDEAALDALMKAGVTAGTLAAMAMAPLVRVAWADGTLDDAERDALLKAAAQSGMTEGSAGYSLFQSWLVAAPGAELDRAWEEYVTVLCESLDPAAKDKLRNDIVSRTRGIAEASGGFLGLATVSGKEREALDAIEGALS